METNSSNSELFQKIKKLKLPKGKYALFGSAQLGARGLRDCYDIDIIVTEDLWNEYKNKLKWELKNKKEAGDYLEKDNMELWKNWGPGKWDIDNLIKEAERIDDLPFVRLEEVLKWKKIRKKEKDIKDIKMIEKLLKEQK